MYSLTRIARVNIRGKIPAGDCCAVIGNGPSVSNIDIDNSFVIRCNNSTGKADLNITSMYNPVSVHIPCPILCVMPMSTIYQKYTESKWQHLNWRKNADDLIKKGNEVWLYGELDDFAEVFGEVAESINSLPTTGIMGIALARWIGFRKIILSGFTFFRVGYDRPVTAHHNPGAEMNLLREWISEDDRVYILDGLTKAVLYDNR